MLPAGTPVSSLRASVGERVCGLALPSYGVRTGDFEVRPCSDFIPRAPRQRLARRPLCRAPACAALRAICVPQG
eukprot:12674396-Alexandrium_andersonii.AAC.1